MQCASGNYNSAVTYATCGWAIIKSLQWFATIVHCARVTVYLSIVQGVLAVQPVKPLLAIDNEGATGVQN